MESIPELESKVSNFHSSAAIERREMNKDLPDLGIVKI